MISNFPNSLTSEVYLPAIGKSNKDLKSRSQLLQNLNNLDIKTGLMLLLPSEQDLEDKPIKITLRNLKLLQKKQEKLRVFLMHPNKPLTGNRRLNFLDNPDWSKEYVQKSIDLCAMIGDEFSPGGGKLLSFHLNTLIAPFSWKNDKFYWNRKFVEICRCLTELVSYANLRKVRLAVETVPIPEFGDVLESDDYYLKKYDCFWSDLGNPWPLFLWRDEISKIREVGCSIVIDWSHSFIALATLKQLIKLPDRVRTLERYMIYEEDLEFADSVKSFSSLVNDSTEDGDIWHVNDARGIHKYKDIFGKEEVFYEGVVLNDGEIPQEEINKLIISGLNKQIKFVIEVNETDFKRSPNTKKTLEVIMKCLVNFH